MTTIAGSRRRRLWELDGHAHCPVIGVCLPMAALRRIVGKVLGGEAVADDYELHCDAITECRTRTPIAEAMRKELDRRCLPALRQAASAKSTEALTAWWRQAATGPDLAGALWAVLTHARCTPELQHRVLGEVHMLQHQIGMALRVNLVRLDTLTDENATLTRELALARQRNVRQAAEQARRIDDQQNEMVRLRAALIGRDAALAAAREQHQALEDAVPGLRSRFELARAGQRQTE